ncbi:MAG TPA: LysR family transcriptional regulator [Mesorhizobium sp.]|jgi:DNA-binding transcriptional LysR family regulator|uniref:LysR family transcriptional regulator n=1 Tax=Mesorhizobium sp. TaxID=1871066 RepID=UPI002DDD687F|nr:LysR family transcriptional regulator [Mesorhizobium sp.]HEV2504174.1 LysR family transcriptional regulator [Mesorhizobium sp.]
MDISKLSDFNTIALHGGFSAASRASGIPKTTLSRRLSELEEELGVRLIERGTRALRLTEEGRLLRDRSAHLIEELAEVGEEVAGHAGRPRGRLKVSVPGLFAHTALGRIVAEFVGAYPDVTVEVSVNDQFVDPIADEFDIVVRANPEPNTDLVGQCFLRDDLVFAASPRLPIPEKDGSSVPAVDITVAHDATEWMLTWNGEPRIVRPRTVLRCSSMLLVYNAVLAGAGAAIMPRWLAEPDFRTGALVDWGTVPGRRVDAWALHTSRHLTSPKVKAFVAMLMAAYDPATRQDATFLARLAERPFAR